METSSASGQDHGHAGRNELISLEKRTAESWHISNLYNLYAVSLTAKSLQTAEA